MQNKKTNCLLKISAVSKRRSQAKFQKQILECMCILHPLARGEEKFEKENVFYKKDNLDHFVRSDE
jgi:hypothetical protein